MTVLMLETERTCPNCEGRGRVDDEGDEGEQLECPECDGHRVQQRCPLCGDWCSYEPDMHACPVELAAVRSALQKARERT